MAAVADGKTQDCLAADGQAADALLTAAAVRDRCALVLEAAHSRSLQHFAVRLDRLERAADFVTGTVRANYPSLHVPFHARWRHFVVDGVDRWRQAAAVLSCDRDERARIRLELAVTSVLLDAGAGPRWRWRDPVTGRLLARSEGLAIASLDAFRAGLFSSDAAEPMRADARGLESLTVDALAAAFQVTPDNPLAGLEGRVALLNRLGRAVSADATGFGPAGRLGHLYDRLMTHYPGRALPAAAILRLVLQALGPIWPGRIALGGLNLGDTWRHPAVAVDGPTRGLVPLHKLSQWIAYSMIEPLQEAGITVDEIGGLTGLAEYRNGGLFVDLGVLVPTRPEILEKEWQPGAEPIVEWRALTVALLDRLAPLVVARLGVDLAAMPLAAVLEGGTWSAGRRIAAAMRPDGGPPIRIISDGSVF